MFRFIMPEKTMSPKERSFLLKTQMNQFLKQEALADLFSLLHTSRERIGNDYNGRVGANGHVRETQVMEPSGTLKPLQKQLYPLFAELGFFHINTPLAAEHSRLLILGGAMNVCFTRTQFAVQWLTPSTRSVDGLSCYRPINPKEREKSVVCSSYETEFGVLADAFSSTFQLSAGGYQDYFEGDRNLNRISCIREYTDQKNGCTFRVYAAPSTQPELRRADTGDTLSFYLEESGIQAKPDAGYCDYQPETLLVITSNRYCNRQFLQLSYYLLEKNLPLDLDVIGCIPDREVVTAETYDPFQYLQDLISILDWIGRFGL